MRRNTETLPRNTQQRHPVGVRAAACRARFSESPKGEKQGLAQAGNASFDVGRYRVPSAVEGPVAHIPGSDVQNSILPDETCPRGKVDDRQN